MKRFTLGSSSISELEKQYVQAVLDANYISPGPVTRAVEEQCAAMHGLKHGLAMNSGQTAIQVALQAIVDTRLDRHDGEKPLVAVPACTYISTLAAVIFAGCEFILVDVELPSGNMSPQRLKETLERQKQDGDPVDIVIPVHLYGKACDPRILTIAAEYGAYIVEDSCESTFAPNTGRGHILTTSFFSNHLISGGGGGLVMTNDDELDNYCWKLVNHGRSSRFGNEDIHQIAEKFHFDDWGHSAKWNDVSAAIVKAQIERKDELYEARRRNAAILDEVLEAWENDGVLFRPPSDGHCYMMYPIILAEHVDANRVMTYLNDHGVEIRRMMPITNQPVVRNYFNSNLHQEFPVAHLINRQGFYVGVHPELSVEDMYEMGSVIHEALRQEDA